jgi:hypothetical protein
MTNIDTNRIKGNFGSAYISYRLSEYCLVRQVTEGTDIGIDLYCESFTDIGSPYLHFWVQVKTGESINVSKDKKSASFPFSVEHLKYWQRQPVPVFAFLVPVEWPQKKETIDVFVVNITDYMLKTSIPESKKTITLESNKVLRSKSDYLEFIKVDVSYLTAAQNITKGAVRMIPVFDPEYIFAVPTGYSIKYMNNILWQIRSTAGVAIQDIYKEKNDIENKLEYIKILTKVLEAYSEDKHWEVHYSLGLAYLIVNDKHSAKSSFEKSHNIIESDPNIIQESWSHNKRMLRELIRECE